MASAARGLTRAPALTPSDTRCAAAMRWTGFRDYAVIGRQRSASGWGREGEAA